MGHINEHRLPRWTWIMHIGSMVIIPGPPAFSPARLDKRLARLRQRHPGLTAATADFVHVLDVERALTETELATLTQLLTYGPRLEKKVITGRTFVVVPRLGTRSPWSSKATDIANNCGLSVVRRIERGIVWTLAGE